MKSVKHDVMLTATEFNTLSQVGHLCTDGTLLTFFFSLAVGVSSAVGEEAAQGNYT